jgi:hypothetical protein
MHLKRIRVPNFRVLKDVDISFELDLVPQIFPLGSINGGGKSTLLQLIFTLLHCPGKYERLPYLQNMLDGFTLDDNSSYRDLASIELIIDGQEIELDFFVCDRNYIDNDLNIVGSDNKIVELDPDIKIASLTSLHNSLDNSWDLIIKVKKRQLEEFIDQLAIIDVESNSPNFIGIYERFVNNFIEQKFPKEEIDEINRLIPDDKIIALLLEFNQLKVNSDESKQIAIELLKNIEMPSIDAHLNC